MARSIAGTGRKPATLVLGPWGARALSGSALVAMHAWFLLKLTSPSDLDGVERVAGALALAGLLASVTVFVCTYGVMANAPSEWLDEWQLTERNRAYFSAFKYLTSMLLVGSIGAEVCARLYRMELKAGVMQDYLMLMFATAMVLPASLMAWRDTPLGRD